MDDGADTGLVHREVLELEATPEQVLEFVMTPERVCDYFTPPPLDAGTFEPGRSLWVQSESGACVLERVEEECTDALAVVLVTMALGLEPPYTLDEVVAATTFTFVEDWAVEPSGSGCRLTKSWRDVRMTADLGFPLEEAMRETAASESDTLVARWNEAARGGD